MADRHVVGMLMLHFGTPRDQEARWQLADALPPGSEVAEPDLPRALARPQRAPAAA
ncbi:hypothetical protein [Baekduia sp. Peel2402]|uniref:hypothetical protein n=1 Tax=Baekduia sp. Peel2402 TaxID=3458296 RepID=UPI00403E7B93